VSILAPDILTVDPRLFSLLKLSESGIYSAKALLADLRKSLPSYNAAEQFLFFLAQAIQANNNKQFNEAVALLETMRDLEQNIPKNQRIQPVFSNAHLIRAQSYVALDQFDLAFLEKKAYLKAFYAYSSMQKKNTIALLTKKHALTQKKEVNELLKNENKLKGLQIAKIQNQEQNHYYLIVLIVSTIAVFILLFIRQLVLRKKLIKLAKVDVLTGIANRTVLFELGGKMIEEQSKQPRELSVVLLDVDNFKSINDKYGHQVGDKVLIQIALLGCEAMRSRDLFSRLGGEEFVALLPNTSIAEAKAIAERIKEKISTFDFQLLGCGQQVTVSLGVVCLCQLNNEAENSFDTLLHAADLAMYQAKARGKNQVISYDAIANESERRKP
jgi:diguanylate cyclase (GGDEF)-like protein